MRAKEFLTERVLNLFPGDERREKYKQAAYDMLQRTYKSKGGIKGAGFQSPDDMVENIPFWKLVKKNGNIVAGAFYKDKGGRKLVASGTDGSDAGKQAVSSMATPEPKRSYGEKSKEALGFFLKSVDDPQQYLIPFEKAQSISQDPIISVKDAWPELSAEEKESASLSLKKYPFLKDYGYFRDIGGAWHFKVMSGTPGIPMVY